MRTEGIIDTPDTEHYCSPEKPGDGEKNPGYGGGNTYQVLKKASKEGGKLKKKETSVIIFQ